MTKARLKQFQKVELQKPKYEPSANLRHPHPTDFLISIIVGRTYWESFKTKYYKIISSGD